MYDIEVCIVIGGNGIFMGVFVFIEEYNILFIGVLGMIDNDLYGMDMIIGFDMAVNIVIEVVDKIWDIVDFYNWLFFVEVMGWYVGFIVLNIVIGSGVVSVLILEMDIMIEDLVEFLKMGVWCKKFFSVVIVVEGNKNGNVSEIVV